MFNNLKKINKLSSVLGDRWVKVKLKDGRTLTCQADCFGWEEAEDGDDIPNLKVNTKTDSEILIESDIESVEEI